MNNSADTSDIQINQTEKQPAECSQIGLECKRPQEVTLLYLTHLFLTGP